MRQSIALLEMPFSTVIGYSWVGITWTEAHYSNTVTYLCDDCCIAMNADPGGRLCGHGPVRGGKSPLSVDAVSPNSACNSAVAVLWQLQCRRDAARDTMPNQSENRIEFYFYALQPDFAEEATVPLPVMPFGQIGSTYVVLGRPEGSLALGKFSCTLRFTVKEIDPSTGEACITLTSPHADSPCEHRVQAAADVQSCTMLGSHCSSGCRGHREQCVTDLHLACTRFCQARPSNCRPVVFTARERQTSGTKCLTSANMQARRRSRATRTNTSWRTWM